MSSDLDLLTSADEGARLAALRRLAAATPRPAPAGTNTHVHTNYSFSAFANPAQAAWLARQAGVEIFGINDHYTVEGHREFRAACAALHLPATFSIESVALDETTAKAGVLMNDPGNPGRTYLCGKGVTDAGNAKAAATLAELRRHQEVRNQALTAKADAWFRAKAGHAGPTWKDITDQTPAGNTTERHLARAIAWRIAAIAKQTNRAEGDLFAAVVGKPLPAGGDAVAQNLIRGELLKAGKPLYVDEAPAAYPSVPALRQLYLDLGAIPTYPVLGNPLTGGEKDIAALCDRLAGWGIYALELIPHRNTDDRVAAVLDEAAKRGWPVFDGTEHNTPVMDPLLTKWGSDPRFRARFKDGALTLLGHQALVAKGQPGYVTRDGAPVPGGLQRCIEAGRAVEAATLAGRAAVA